MRVSVYVCVYVRVCACGCQLCQQGGADGVVADATQVAPTDTAIACAMHTSRHHAGAAATGATNIAASSRALITAAVTAAAVILAGI